MSGPLPEIATIMPYTLLPVLAGISGGVVATVRPLGRRLGSIVEHFTAGVVFAAVAGEILPDLHAQAPLAVVVGFSAGTLVLLLIGAATRQFEKAVVATGLLVAVGVDLLIDGFVLGIGFVTGAKQGLLLTIALTLEVLFLGVTTQAELGKAGIARVRALALLAGLVLALPVGTGIGILLLSRLPAFARAATFAFGASALLYLVTEELLVEAHDVPETSATTAAFFVGFLMLFVIEMIA